MCTSFQVRADTRTHTHTTKCITYACVRDNLYDNLVKSSDRHTQLKTILPRSYVAGSDKHFILYNCRKLSWEMFWNKTLLTCIKNCTDVNDQTKWPQFFLASCFSTIPVASLVKERSWIAPDFPKRSLTKRFAPARALLYGDRSKTSLTAALVTWLMCLFVNRLWFRLVLYLFVALLSFVCW